MAFPAAWACHVSDLSPAEFRPCWRGGSVSMPEFCFAQDWD